MSASKLYHVDGYIKLFISVTLMQIGLLCYYFVMANYLPTNINVLFSLVVSFAPKDKLFKSTPFVFHFMLIYIYAGKWMCVTSTVAHIELWLPLFHQLFESYFKT